MSEQNSWAVGLWQAPASWQSVDFMSDIHLHVQDPETFLAWKAWLQQPLKARSDALCILGDLFEVWVGDDVLHASALNQDHDDRIFWQTCAQLLKQYSEHTPVFFMAGNRDFLLRNEALQRCGMQALQDPTVLEFKGRRWLLSHGDAWCLNDVEYLRFRAIARQSDWQQAFLGKPLAEREQLARRWRAESEAKKLAQAHQADAWADVDAQAAHAALKNADAQVLIHGHTHRPAVHDLGEGLQRWVLSDWDLKASPPRAEWIRLDSQGLHRHSLPAAISSG
ncbi:MAG: UDP-2,3-diacylglucosamine diphosphatase [Pseudomonadota bacterium]|jgi:UDP-2,3-diacylglucosamine hydrolase